MTDSRYEIERKFLISDLSVIEGLDGIDIKQGYLCVEPDRTVRVRTANDDAWLTIKNRPSGLKRLELEYSIPLDDAEILLSDLCIGTIIHKTRYRVQSHGKTWEVDIFHSPTSSLQVAEVELDDENEAIEIPNWVGEEVTGNPAYSNSKISLQKF